MFEALNHSQLQPSLLPVHGMLHSRLLWVCWSAHECCHHCSVYHVTMAVQDMSAYREPRVDIPRGHQAYYDEATDVAALCATIESERCAITLVAMSTLHNLLRRLLP